MAGPRSAAVALRIVEHAAAAPRAPTQVVIVPLVARLLHRPVESWLKWKERAQQGSPLAAALNSVGSRQGCSWDSFLYCLTIHLLRKQLADEFRGCVILAFADDVHIIGPPELAAAAYERRHFLYAALLQGELNDSESKCYSPKISAEAVRAAGMPTDVEIATDGTRVLGGPVGSPDYCRTFRRAWCRRSSRTSTSSVGCRPFRRSTALRWVQFSTRLIICGA